MGDSTCAGKQWHLRRRRVHLAGLRRICGGRLGFHGSVQVVCPVIADVFGVGARVEGYGGRCGLGVQRRCARWVEGGMHRQRTAVCFGKGSSQWFSVHGNGFDDALMMRVLF